MTTFLLISVEKPDCEKEDKYDPRRPTTGQGFMCAYVTDTRNLYWYMANLLQRSSELSSLAAPQSIVVLCACGVKWTH
jgi:hypothetical protein